MELIFSWQDSILSSVREQGRVIISETEIRAGSAEPCENKWYSRNPTASIIIGKQEDDGLGAIISYHWAHKKLSTKDDKAHLFSGSAGKRVSADVITDTFQSLLHVIKAFPWVESSGLLMDQSVQLGHTLYNLCLGLLSEVINHSPNLVNSPS